MGLDEFALCVKREILPAVWLADHAALPARWPDLDFLNGAFEFRCRREIEADSAWKQIIPYVISAAGNGNLLVYRRHGTETRLHGLWSAGIGGHVTDGDAAPADFRTTVLNGMRREFCEEMGIPGRDYTLLGIINEEETDVGHTHLGIVFRTTVPDDVPGSLELGRRKFVSPDRIGALEFELWSSLALGLYCRDGAVPRE